MYATKRRNQEMFLVIPNQDLSSFTLKQQLCTQKTTSIFKTSLG